MSSGVGKQSLSKYKIHRVRACRAPRFRAAAAPGFVQRSTRTGNEEARWVGTTIDGWERLSTSTICAGHCCGEKIFKHASNKHVTPIWLFFTGTTIVRSDSDS